MRRPFDDPHAKPLSTIAPWNTFYAEIKDNFENGLKWVYFSKSLRGN